MTHLLWFTSHIVSSSSKFQRFLGCPLGVVHSLGLDKHIMSCTHQCTVMQNLFIALKILCLIHPSLSSNPWEFLVFFLPPWFFLLHVAPSANPRYSGGWGRRLRQEARMSAGVLGWALLCWAHVHRTFCIHPYGDLSGQGATGLSKKGWSDPSWKHSRLKLPC